VKQMKPFVKCDFLVKPDFVPRCILTNFRTNFLAFFWALAILSSLLTGAISCTSRSSGIELKTADGRDLRIEKNEVLRINITSEPPTLDWNKATDTTSSHVIENIMEGLVQYNLADKELALSPALATEWTASENARIWNFKLRKDVKWTDGVSFEAQQVVDSWRRLLTKETASEYAYFLFAIKNAKAFNEGKVTWDQVGVKVESDGTLRVELEKPMGYFPNLLTHTSTFPIRKDLIEKFGDNKWTEAGSLVTLGPYKLAIWQHDKEILLEANSAYFAGPPPTKYIHAQMIVEQTTAINLFDAGKLDAVDGIPSTELKTQRARKQYRSIGVLQLYYYGMNVKKAPTDNVHLRRALAHAIDRQKLVKLLDGGEIPMTGWVPSGMFGYFADVGLQFNLEKAKAELSKAGYGDGKKPLPKIELHFNTNENHQRIAEAVQSQLKENLGIIVELKNEEWKTYLSKVKTDPPTLFRFGWLADYPDPDNFMNLMTSYSENNRTRWADPRYDKLISQAAGETDREKRRDLYRQANQIMLTEGVPVIPVFTGVAHLLVADRVEGFPVNAMRKFQYKSVRVK
jgi:oligopeptide transport system substrate-binding protein